MHDMTHTRFAPLLLLFLLLVAACATVPASSVAVVATRSPEQDALVANNPDLLAGRTAYELRCAHCHGWQGEGQLADTVALSLDLGMHLVPAHDATGHTWRHPDQLLRQVILSGVPNPLMQYPMPAYAGVMTDAEIDQVIAYMRLWWTDVQRAYQAERTRRYAEITGIQ